MTRPGMDRFRGAFEQATESWPKQPAWLQRWRLDALDQFGVLGFPTRKDEEWKYTSVKSISETTFEIGTLPEDLSEARAVVANVSLDDAAATLVFVNGVWSDELSNTRSLPEGVEVLPLRDALGRFEEAIQQRFDSHGDFENGLAALQGAMIEDGAVIHVPKEVEVPGVIQLVYASTGEDAPIMATPWNLILLERFAKATVLETFVGEDGATTFTNTMTHIVLEDGASLEHAKLQADGDGALHIGQIHADLGRDSNLHTFAFTVGGKLSRDDTIVRVNAEGAHADVNSLYLVHSGQHVDHHTVIDHRVPNGTSDQLYKGILDGSAHGVFNGKVFVRPGAQQTNAEQLNNNLLLSRDARIDTKPQLEIFADDVKCAHGATVGQLDEDLLFYMAARAIDPETARTLLLHGFAHDVLQRVDDDSIRGLLSRILTHTFGN